MAIVATQLKRGQCISYNNELGIVTGLEHRTPGKGNALVMATVRSFKTGKTKDIRFASSDKVGYHFMDPATFDTVTFQEDFIEDSKDLLIDGLVVEVLFVDGKAVTIELPPSIELEVTESAPGVKGDTATAATKEATLQTGLRIQVPLFVGPGDRIRVSSEDKKYLGRA
jgi:elongation factor P